MGTKSDEPSFEEIFEEVSWELCVEAAAMATTDLSFSVCDDASKPEPSKRLRTLDEAVKELLQTENGALRISGTWKAGGKRGDVEVVYFRRSSPSATSTFVIRFLNESIRLKIAKKLMRIKNPNVRRVDDPPERPAINTEYGPEG